MTGPKGKLRPWETALLLALCVTLAAGLYGGRTQAALAGKLVRLHVIAASDDAADQAVKLQVRDAVLAMLTPRLAEAADQSQALALVDGALGEIAAVAAETAGQPVTVTLGREDYPTRVYGNFALPAGNYVSLRVELGAARGHNWWCVVFPPLCTASVQEAAGVLSQEELALLQGDAVLRFRLVELWAGLRQRLG